MGITSSPKAKKLPAELLRVNAQAPEPDALRYAAHFLVRGCVIGIPTDTFYGLATDPFNLAAVDELYRVKGRPETRALPILVNSLDQALVLMREPEEEVSGVDPAPWNFQKLAEAFWPGGLTMVVNASNRVPLKVTANTGGMLLCGRPPPVGVTVAGFMATLKVALSAWLVGTPVARLTGTVEITVGATVAGTVLKVQT